jgi:hypothetical protein
MSSFVSGGAAAAAPSKSSGGAAASSADTPHLHRPNKLLVEVFFVKGQDPLSEEKLMLLLEPKVSGVSRGDIKYEFTHSKKSIKVTIIFENHEYLERVKNILKTTFQTELKRKISVEVVQPKKSDDYVDPRSLLPDFDPKLIENYVKHMPTCGLGSVEPSTKHPAFMEDRFLYMSGCFRISDRVYLKTPVRNTRRANVYERRDTLGACSPSLRIAHPDCPGLLEKCLDMCGTANSSFEQHWKPHGYVDIPEEILRNPICWSCNFFAIGK